MRKFEQPDEIGSYDRWEMKLTKNVAPLVKEWADMVLFANYKTFVVAEPPVCNYSLNSFGTGAVSVVPMTRGAESTATHITQIMVTRPTSVSGINVEVHWNVKGRWK